MDKISVPPRSTLTLDSVDGDLETCKHATVKGTEPNATLKVSGTVYCEGDNNYECNLSAHSLQAEDNVTIHGDLEVTGDIKKNRKALAEARALGRGLLNPD